MNIMVIKLLFHSDDGRSSLVIASIEKKSFLMYLCFLKFKGVLFGINENSAIILSSTNKI